MVAVTNGEQDFRAQELDLDAPRKGDDEVVLLLLHHVEEDLDRLLAVVLVVGRVVEVVRLVNQQDTTECLLDHFLRHTSARGVTRKNQSCADIQ